MNLKTDDFLVKLYNEVYDKLPTNVCSFFWGTFYIMLNFLTTIFGIIQLSVSYYYYNKDKSSAIDAIIGITYLERFLQVLFISNIIQNLKITTNYILLDYIIFISLIVVTIILFYFLTNFIGFISDIISNYSNSPSKQKNNKQPGLIKTYFKSIKEKYCELITYTD
jgi:hypothetical protein